MTSPNSSTPSALRPLHFKPLNGVRIVVWTTYALILLALPLVAQSSFALTLLCMTGIAAVACLSYNMLLGQAGMLSFGHAVYTGLGTFVAIQTMNKILGGWPLPMWLVPLVGGFAGLGFGALLGYVTTRKAGTPFSMITLGVGELVFASALMFPEFFGGEAGINSNRTGGTGWLHDLGLTFGPQIQVYYLIAIYLFICTAAMYAFTMTPLGRIANAVRDNAERAEFVGYDTRWVRYLIVITKAWQLYVGVIFLIMVVYAPGGFSALLMLNLRRVKYGEWRKMRWPYAGMVFFGLIALWGIAAIVEMAYQIQVAAGSGSALTIAGIPLDSSSHTSWAVAIAVMVVGGAAFEYWRRKFAKVWSDGEERIAEAAKKAEAAIV